MNLAQQKHTFKQLTTLRDGLTVKTCTETQSSGCDTDVAEKPRTRIATENADPARPPDTIQRSVSGDFDACRPRRRHRRQKGQTACIHTGGTTFTRSILRRPVYRWRTDCVSRISPRVNHRSDRTWTDIKRFTTLVCQPSTNLTEPSDRGLSA